MESLFKADFAYILYGMGGIQDIKRLEFLEGDFGLLVLVQG